MKFILMLFPYPLVPIIVAMLVMRFAASQKWITYLITLGFFICYPFLLMQVENYFTSETGFRCAIPFAAVLYFGMIFFLPTSMVIQFIANLYFFKNRVAE